MKYQVTVKVLVDAPESYSRAALKFVHGLVQSELPNQSQEVDGGTLEIVGASAEAVEEIKTNE